MNIALSLLLCAKEASLLEVTVIPVKSNYATMGKYSSKKPLKTKDFIVQVHKKKNLSVSEKTIMLSLFPMHVSRLLAYSWL